MKYYWSPSEPNTLRFPKPEGVECYEVDETFRTEAAIVIMQEDGTKVAGQDPDILAELGY